MSKTGKREAKTCPLCGQSAQRRLALPHTGVFECSNKDCQLRFAHPQLSELELEAAYRKLYYPERDSGEPVRYENTPNEMLRQVFARAAVEFGGLAGRRILDFGCGLGALCHISIDFGMRPTGIEPNCDARRKARENGFCAVYASLGDLLTAEPDVQFDFIVLWDVIEHLREPWRDLEALAGLLRPNGWLWGSTPNTASLRAWFLGARWENFVNPTHFYYFTETSLVAVLRRAGFQKFIPWSFPIAYPHHGRVRRVLNRLLVTTQLNGQLLFAAGAPLPVLRSSAQEVSLRVVREIEESIAVKTALVQEAVEAIAEAAALIVERLGAGNKLIVFGNGGSAADAQHIAAELVGRYRAERRALPAIALTTNTSALTAVGNDYGFDSVFNRQLQALGQPGDVALAISTSGNSSNVVHAVETAKQMGIHTIGLTGKNGGKLRTSVELCLCVPSDATPRIQEAHILIGHILSEIVEQALLSQTANVSQELVATSARR